MSDWPNDPTKASAQQGQLSLQALMARREAERVKYDGMLASIRSACHRHIAIVTAERDRVEARLTGLLNERESAQ